MKLSKYFKVISVLIVLIATLISAVPVSADSYAITHREFSIPIPKPFTAEKVIMYIDGLDKQMDVPTDIFVSKDNNLYIVDANNSRIIKTDKNGKLLGVYGDAYGEISQADSDKKVKELQPKADKSDKKAKYEIIVTKAKAIKKLNQPEGIYVDDEGDMFIADTQNQRIVHLAPDGKFVEAFYQPSEDTFDTSYPFNPSKIYIDAVHRLYIANAKDFHGIIVLDSTNKFLGYLAASKIAPDATYLFYKTFMPWILPLITRQTPPYFTNFLINNSDGLIYAVQRDAKTQQLQMLTPAGDNILKAKLYGERVLNPTSNVNEDPMFNDIAVNNEGIIYACDSKSQKIYIYDQDGNNLAVFGGKSDKKEYTRNVSSIALDSDGNLYVVDQELNLIQVYKPTMFLNKVMEASALYTSGKYEEAVKPWNEVLDMHSTYVMAVRGIAKAKYREGDYIAAMKLSELAVDKEGYSESFYDYRLDIFRDYFTWVVLTVLLLIVALYFLLKYLSKLSAKAEENYDYTTDKFGIRLFFDTLILMIFHPIDGFNKLKAQRDRYGLHHIIALVILIVFMRVTYIYAVHFPLSTVLPQYTDFWQENLSFFIPLALWAVVCFALTSISDGKTKFKETIVYSLFSFTPYILFTLPLALLSQVLSTREGGFYDILTFAVMAWSIILLLLGTMNLNEYGFGKLVWTVVKVLFGIACTLMIAGIFYILILQLFTFIKEVNEEIVYMIR